MNNCSVLVDPVLTVSIRVLNEKCLNCASVSSDSGCVRSLLKALASFFGDHWPFLYSDQASCTSSTFSPPSIADPSVGIVSGLSFCLTAKMGQKTYSRRFQTTGIT